MRSGAAGNEHLAHSSFVQNPNRSQTNGIVTPTQKVRYRRGTSRRGIRTANKRHINRPDARYIVCWSSTGSHQTESEEISQTSPGEPDRVLFPRQRLVTRNEERQIENATALQLLKLRRFTQRDPSEKSDQRDPIEQQPVVEMRAVQSIQRDAGGRPSLGMKTASHPVAYWQKTTIQCGLCPSPSDRRSANPSERNARLSYRSSSISQSALRDVRCYCPDCRQGRLPLGLSFFVKCLPCTHEMVRNIQTPSRKTDRNLMLHLLTSSHSSLLTYSRQATRFSAGPFG